MPGLICDLKLSLIQIGAAICLRDIFNSVDFECRSSTTTAHSATSGSNTLLSTTMTSRAISCVSQAVLVAALVEFVHLKLTPSE
jgi:hypothetical protein